MLAISRKITYIIFELQTAIHFLIKRFYLLEQLTDKLCLLRCEHLAESFLKMIEVSLSLYGKQLTVFVANENI